jgi:hypothetical protein
MPRRLSTPEFINRANRVHRGRYAYTRTEYIGSLEPVTVTCKLHGDFTQRATDHLAGHGCPVCGRIRQIEAISKSRAEFISNATHVHGGRYDYSQVIYQRSTMKVKIICPEHGVFLQTPANHLSGHGCKKCRKQWQS